MEKTRIFISSTMEDLQNERKAVVEAINENPFWKAIYAESFVADTRSPREICLDEVRKSDMYIGIFKNRYGYIPPHNNSGKYSVVHLEYNEAKKNGLAILLFIDKNSHKREVALIKFLESIADFETGHWRKEYSAVEELTKFVVEAITQEIVKVYVTTTHDKRIKIKKTAEQIYELPYYKRIIGEI